VRENRGAGAAWSTPLDRTSVDRARRCSSRPASVQMRTGCYAGVGAGGYRGPLVAGLVRKPLREDPVHVWKRRPVQLVGQLVGPEAEALQEEGVELRLDGADGHVLAVRGLTAAHSSGPIPSRSQAPGRKPSTSTSALATRSSSVCGSFFLHVEIDDALPAVQQINLFRRHLHSARPTHAPHQRPDRPGPSRHAAPGRWRRVRQLSPLPGVRRRARPGRY